MGAQNKKQKPRLLRAHALYGYSNALALVPLSDSILLSRLALSLPPAPVPLLPCLTYLAPLSIIPVWHLWSKHITNPPFSPTPPPNPTPPPPLRLLAIWRYPSSTISLNLVNHFHGPSKHHFTCNFTNLISTVLFRTTSLVWEISSSVTWCVFLDSPVVMVTKGFEASWRLFKLDNGKKWSKWMTVRWLWLRSKVCMLGNFRSESPVKLHHLMWRRIRYTLWDRLCKVIPDHEASRYLSWRCLWAVKDVRQTKAQPWQRQWGLGQVKSQSSSSSRCGHWGQPSQRWDRWTHTFDERQR